MTCHQCILRISMVVVCFLEMSFQFKGLIQNADFTIKAILALLSYICEGQVGHQKTALKLPSWLGHKACRMTSSISRMRRVCCLILYHMLLFLEDDLRVSRVWRIQLLYSKVPVWPSRGATRSVLWCSEWLRFLTRYTIPVNSAVLRKEIEKEDFGNPCKNPIFKVSSLISIKLGKQLLCHAKRMNE